MPFEAFFISYLLLQESGDPIRQKLLGEFICYFFPYMWIRFKEREEWQRYPEANETLCSLIVC